MTKLDWVSDVETKFGDDLYLRDLKAKSFYGTVSLNFSNGAVMNYDMKIHRVVGQSGSAGVFHTYTTTETTTSGGKDGDR